MRKALCFAMLILLARHHVLGDSSGLFPMSDITIGMSSEDLLKKHPTEEILFEKRNNEQILMGGLLVYEVSANRFWDTIAVCVSDAKVEALAYSYIGREFEGENPMLNDEEKIRQKMAQDIKPLFQELKKQLGGSFEKKIFGVSTERTAIYVWEREKGIVTFNHAPIAWQEKGNVFGHQLTIVTSLDFFGDQIATDSLPEDALLWVDAMGEEKGDLPNRWVYVCAALVTFCAIAYLIRRKR